MTENANVITNATEANAAHKRIVGSVNEAIAIGEFLETQKAELKHGEWLPWFKTNIEFSLKTGDNYRTLYKNRDKFVSLTNSGLFEAIKLCTRKEKPEATPGTDYVDVLYFDGRSYDLKRLPRERVIEQNLEFFEDYNAALNAKYDRNAALRSGSAQTPVAPAVTTTDNGATNLELEQEARIINGKVVEADKDLVKTVETETDETLAQRIEFKVLEMLRFERDGKNAALIAVEILNKYLEN